MSEQNNSEQKLLQEIEQLKQKLTEYDQSFGNQFYKTSESETIKSILNAVPHAIVGLVDRKIVFANDAVKSVFDWEVAEIIDQSTRIFYKNDEDYQAIGVLAYNALEKRDYFSMDFSCQTKQGKDIICNISAARYGNVLKDNKIVVMYEDITERRKIELDQLLFRNLMEQSQDGIFIIDPDTAMFTDVNIPACQSLGYTREELLQKTVIDIDPLFTYDLWTKHVQNMKIMPNKVIETIHQRKDSSQFPVEISIRYITIDEKDYIISTVRDITERKKIETSQVLFTTLMEQSRDAILFISLESGQIIYANKEACESMGYEKAELLSKTVLDIDPLFTPERWVKHVQMIKESKPEMLLNTIHRRKDGFQFPVEVSIKLVSFEQKNYLISIGRDISERKKIEAELKQSAAEWHRTFDALDDLIFIQDMNHVIIRVNKAFAKYLGLDPKQIEGKKCYELMHKQGSAWSECPMEFTKKDQQSHTAEVDDPQIGIPLRVTTSPIFDQQGKMTESVHIARDISQEKQATKELKRKMHDLEIFRKSAVGREMKMMEMKKKIQELENQCKK